MQSHTLKAKSDSEAFTVSYFVFLLIYTQLWILSDFQLLYMCRDEGVTSIALFNAMFSLTMQIECFFL